MTTAHFCNHANECPSGPCDCPADCPCRVGMCKGMPTSAPTERTFTEAELRYKMLDWRGVEDPCARCDGSGRCAYSNSSTWRGGAGAAAIASDVCDQCWGTGDRYRHGVNLRQLRDEEKTRIAKAALTAVADSVGAHHGAGHSATVMIELDRVLDRKRNPMNVFASSTLLGLRNLIARAIGVQERKL